VSGGRGIRTVTVRANAATLARLAPVVDDVMASARVERHALATEPSVADGAVEIADVAFADAPETEKPS
jgi:hypothetical protein